MGGGVCEPYFLQVAFLRVQRLLPMGIPSFSRLSRLQSPHRVQFHSGGKFQCLWEILTE